MEFLNFNFGDIKVLVTTTDLGDLRLSAPGKRLAAAKNLQKVKENLRADKLVLPRQVHSARAEWVDETYAGFVCDGLVTSARGVALGVLSADCMGVLLYSGSAFAVLHCGWRGLASGLIARGVRLLRARGASGEIGAFLAPCILQSDYEVREDLARAFAPRFAPAFLRKSGKIYFGLQEAARIELAGLGVRLVSAAEFSTFSDERFYSYRRNGKAAGRFGMFACAH